MHDNRRFAPVSPGHYSPAPLDPHGEPAAPSQRSSEVARPAPPAREEPLFLDEPEQFEPARPTRGVPMSDLFLDEGSPAIWQRTQPAGQAIWDHAQPVLSPTIDAHGELRFASSPRTRITARLMALPRPSLFKAIIVVGIALVLVGIAIFRTQGVSPLSF